MKPWIQLCAFDDQGVGIDDIPEVLTTFETPAAGRLGASGLIQMYPAISQVWVRKITDGHLRTVAWVRREEQI